MDEYVKFQPDIMITHDVISVIGQIIINQYRLNQEAQLPITYTRTSQALNAMFDAYQPKKWIFGHFHSSFKYNFGGCDFQCLNELETLYLDEHASL